MAVKAGDPIWVAPSASASIGGETLPPLILNAIGTRYFIDARLDGSIQDGNIESTTQGAPTLTLTVLDPDGEMLNSSLLTRRIDLVLDNVPFRLVQVSRQEDDLLTLEFEHRLCSWLREHTTPRKASRGTKTRAEFAYSLVLEVKKEHVVFISPDAHKKQPRAAEVVKASTRKGRDGRKAPGFSDNATNIKDGSGRSFTRSQLKNADEVLSVAAAKNASPKATLALAEACIVEPAGFRYPDGRVSRPFDNPPGGDSSSVGILQLLNIHYGGSVAARRDITRVASDFLDKGFSGKGGAIALAKANPSQSAGWVAQQVQGSAFPLRYDQVRSVAQRVVDAWRGASSGGLSDAQQTGSPKFEFTRGAVHKGDANEDSWVALQRLADEVRWRCFIDGRNVLYFVSDDQLMRSRPLYLVSPHTEGVRSVTFDMEVGKRTVVYKGRRIHKPSEAILKVRMGRWAAPIVDSMSRGIFDSEAEVHLRQPQKALPEPAASRTSGSPGGDSRTGGGGGGDSAKGSSSSVDKVYSKALEIHRRNLPYGAGGHGQEWGAADQAGSLDCSSSTSLALNAGGFMSNVRGPVVSDWFRTWGMAGEGKLMTVWVHPGAGPNGHVWIEFHGRNAKRFDTSPWGSGGRGPHLRYTDRSKAGFQARHAGGT
jgi:hypothetical protein